MMKNEQDQNEVKDKKEVAESAEPEEGEEELQELLEEEEEKEEQEAEEQTEKAPELKEAQPEEKEKAKAPSREKEEAKEEEIVEERTYNVPLSRAWIMPPSKRAPRAMRILKSFVIKNMKLETKEKSEEGEEEESKRLIVSNEVNERIWGRSIEKPPRKLRVRAAKDKDGNVTVYLAKGE